MSTTPEVVTARSDEPTRGKRFNSIMPAYPWLIANELDTSSLPARIRALRKIGVRYHLGYEDIALAELEKQAAEIAKDLLDKNDDQVPGDVEKRELTALIAYLFRLGTDITVAEGD